MREPPLKEFDEGSIAQIERAHMADHPSLEDLSNRAPLACPACHKPTTRAFINLASEPPRQLCLSICWTCRWLYSIEERPLIVPRTAPPEADDDLNIDGPVGAPDPPDGPAAR